jgi:alkanesulfonate monooxygenase SsuD/methylene tetrahydromethanopterin reductase-like flavin-dependent oxidoreductase (luciferase family)
MSFNHPLRFGIVVGIHASWPELERRTRLAEELGFDIAWVTDHFFGGSDEMNHTFECYAVLAAMAMASERIRLGVMVAANTYRNPIVLLKEAVTVDHISNGRLDFGIGSGFWEREHLAYSYYVDAPFVPKPVQQPEMPIVIGAFGPRMLGVTAKHADIWNTRRPLEDSRAKSEYLTEKCLEIGRDPAAIKRSIWPAGEYFTSVGKFTEFVESFQGAGFSDFLFSWPVDDEQEAVLHEVAENVIPELRSA